MPLPPAAASYFAGQFNERSPSGILLAAFAAYLGRVGGKSVFDLGVRDDGLYKFVNGADEIFATQVPLRFDVDVAQGFDAFADIVARQLEDVRSRHTYIRDVVVRYPELGRLRGTVRESFPVIVEIGEGAENDRLYAGHELTLRISDDGSSCEWVWDPRVLDGESIERMQQQFSVFLESIAKDSSQRIESIPLLCEQEKNKLLIEWNDTAKQYANDLCIHSLFERQVEITPDATALVFQDESLTYEELNSKVNQLAHYLRTLGVGPDSLVGVCVKRSIEMMISVLAVHKAGGAYVPLDPAYPKDRIAFMLEDARASVLLTQQELLKTLPEVEAKLVCIDSHWHAITQQSTDNPDGGATPENLAYVIYTSGSTGKPKGVMVEHRNAVNFFTGMDDRISWDPPGVWLAVTSLSFDISVLELFWTLSHGFKVVIYSDESRHAGASAPSCQYSDKPMDFSLFYWNLAGEDAEVDNDKYRLLMESAKFGDTHGFSAVWVPERHFHSFGGLYPNPSVISAAIAVETSRIRLRSGSCVLPLHHPIRVVEEWSMVDNLSKGRVDLGIANGWQPNDFVFKPENHANNKQVMIEYIDIVRKLWRGEKATFPGPKGDVEVATYPRPIQPELTVSLTAAGNPETFKLAGQIGARILTHLLGQTVEEVAEKLDLYRQTWKECGHPGEGHVTLMLHTFVSDDESFARETARGPMKTYLTSAATLVKQAAWYFPTYQKKSAEEGQTLDEFFDSASSEDMDALLEFAYERYYRTSGLIGTPERCMEMVDKLKAIGVDEIGCLIDYGIPTDVVLAQLPHLNRLREMAAADSQGTGSRDYSIPALIERHEVTHLQCTPSMARMLTTESRGREALRGLQQMMVGGEAFPRKLAADLVSLISGKVTNMYGPTETTIWSSTFDVNDVSGSIPIGRPIANTDLYVLDKEQRPVPMGVPGELYIGGDGVVRGYLNRAELTAERFVPHPFSDEPGRRLYRTGDLVRYLPDGNIEFLGRIDFQVKIRGYRIELGEIESLIQQHPVVRDAVVLLREDMPGNKQLVAYIVPHQSQAVIASDIRDHLKVKLAEFMVPSAYVVLDALPLTPNGKVDRRALPEPTENLLAAEASYVAPRTATEKALAKDWETLLRADRIGVNDNFFDVGGDSLLAIQLVCAVTETFGVDLPLQAVFEAPSVAALAERIDGLR